MKILNKIIGYFDLNKRAAVVEAEKTRTVIVDGRPYSVSIPEGGWNEEFERKLTEAIQRKESEEPKLHRIVIEVRNDAVIVNAENMSFSDTIAALEVSKLQLVSQGTKRGSVEIVKEK